MISVTNSVDAKVSKNSVQKLNFLFEASNSSSYNGLRKNFRKSMDLSVGTGKLETSH